MAATWWNGGSSTRDMIQMLHTQQAVNTAALLSQQSNRQSIAFAAPAASPPVTNTYFFHGANGQTGNARILDSRDQAVFFNSAVPQSNFEQRSSFSPVSTPSSSPVLIYLLSASSMIPAANGITRLSGSNNDQQIWALAATPNQQAAVNSATSLKN